MVSTPAPDCASFLPQTGALAPRNSGANMSTNLTAGLVAMAWMIDGWPQVTDLTVFFWPATTRGTEIACGELLIFDQGELV